MTAPESLLFLPGAAGDRGMWRAVAAGLRHEGPREFCGWPGFHDLPADPSVHGISDLVARVVSGINRPTCLLAQSMGGVIAIRAALEKPALVRALVLAVASGGIDVAALGGVDWRPAFRAANPGLPTWFLEERADLLARLPEVRMPVLLLFGDADPISPVPVGERLRTLLPNAELVVIPGGTHDLIAERASDVLPHIERHLADARIRSAAR